MKTRAASRVIGWTAIIIGVALALTFLFMPDLEMSLIARIVSATVALALFVGPGAVVLSGTTPSNY